MTDNNSDSIGVQGFGADPAFVASPSSPALSTKGFNPGERELCSIVLFLIDRPTWEVVHYDHGSVVVQSPNGLRERHRVPTLCTSEVRP